MDFEYQELTSTAQAAYAQLMDAALTAEHMRTVADLTGSFSSKTIKGHKYWYFQYTEPSGKLRQLWEIKAAYEDLINRGKGRVSLFERGRKAVEKAYPEIEIRKLLGE